MYERTINIQFTINSENLYFEGIGEMLSRHVSELCSQGNLGHDLAADIYSALAEQLRIDSIDEASSAELGEMVRKGFDGCDAEHEQNTVEHNVMLDAQRRLEMTSQLYRADDDAPSPWQVKNEYEETIESLK